MSRKSSIPFIVLFFLLIWGTSTLAEPNRRSSRRNQKQQSLVNQDPKAANATKPEERSRRKGKFFSLFNVVTFKNDPCTTLLTTPGGNPRRGTCLTMSECSDRSGAASGNCAAGFGVCCLFIVDGTNGNTMVTQNCTYIQNENFPTALPANPNDVTFTVQKCNNDVCFLRLDFETFTLLGVGAATNVAMNEGMCMDTFNVNTPTAIIVPTICGENSGQHRMDGSTAMIAFNFNAAAANRLWDIKVTQVECDNPSAPEDVCLQQLEGLTGRIQTFNFANDENHLNGQQYSICVRQEEGFCCVQYRVCEEFMDPIGAGVNDATEGFSFDTTRAKQSFVDDNCVSTVNSIDYIAIPESSGQCNVNPAQTRAINSRYCGQFLNAVEGLQLNAIICDCTPPFTVDIFFNEVSDTAGATMNAFQSRGTSVK